MKKNIIIKAYTDIEQSKKLSEILPIESADMYYPYDLDSRQLLSIPIVKDDYSMPCIHCWSLAALMNVLPRYLNYNDDKCQLNLYTLDFENQYRKDHCWIIGYWDYDEECEKYNFQIETREDSLIDACYKLVLKLHERKLLN